MAEPLLRVAREIAASHPAFAGHFLARPLLPGVLLLAEVIEAVQAQPALAARLRPPYGIAAAKFLAPVGPGSRLDIVLYDAPRGLRFEAWCAGVLAASGQFTSA